MVDVNIAPNALPCYVTSKRGGIESPCYETSKRGDTESPKSIAHSPGPPVPILLIHFRPKGVLLIIR